MSLRSLVAGALVGLSLVVSATAQHAESDARLVRARQEARAAFAAWQRAHPGTWVLDLDPHGGYAGFVGGGRARVVDGPVGEAELEGVARAALREAEGLLGVDERTLALRRVKYLPLGLAGSTDKWTVSFEQAYGGLAVLGARVNVLLDLEGAVLSLQSTALGGLAGLALVPRLSADAARAAAERAFEDELGLAPTSLGVPRLAIGDALVDEVREPRLVWEVDARWEAPGLVPEGRRTWIDAASGAVLRSDSTVHTFDVGGTVQALATPGLGPDSGANPPAAVPVPHMRVKSPAGNVVTDAAGGFLIPGAVGPLQVTTEFVGPWAHVDDATGPEEVLVQNLSGTANLVQHNTAAAPAITSQANAFLAIGALRDWVRAVDPTDATADFQAYARVNLASACNAYYDGFSVNFFNPGTAGSSTCVNTGYSTVVAHEMGHWLNELYDTGNGYDGMGEGNADVFAMYLYDTPVVGEGFAGAGTNVRTGLNQTLFCGDCCPGCHGGEVHLEGEPWMGAAWKLRARLNTTYGNAPGDLVADALFSAWMNAYDQGLIRSVIELQWLTLDDNNGTLADGTPHYADVDGGFRDQGFPGFDLPAVLYSDVTALGDTVDEVGPYVVSATVVPQTSAFVSAVSLSYRVNGGAWTTFGMVPFGNDLYQVDIPGQTSIAVVEYYLSALDANSVVVDYPEAGLAAPLRFVVGSVNVLFDDDFEGAGDGGWTHGTYGDTPNPHDDFQRGTPAGLAGDPSGAASGANAWGNDLGLGGAWNGAYQGGQHDWLRSPAIDCSAASNTELRFRRWLSVDHGDVARVRVNGVEVFATVPQFPTEDNAWTLETLDVSAAADGQPSVVIEFELAADATGGFGGWNLDDVELRYLLPSPHGVGATFCHGDGSGTACPCGNAGASGAGCANSTGHGAALVGAGSASATLDDLRLEASGLVPGQPALLFAGLNAVNGGAGAVFGDGLRCAGGGIARLGVRAANASGAATWGPGLGAAGGWSAGDTRRFQAWYRDPAGSPCTNAFNLSNGVEVAFQ